MTIGASFSMARAMEMRCRVAAGEVSAGCTAYGLIAVLQPHDELVAAAFLRGVNDLLIACALSARADIVHDRKVKEVVVLRHIGDALRALRQRQRANVHAAQLDRAVLHVPQGGDEPGDGGLSAAGGAHKGVDRPRGDAQIDSVQHHLVVIGKADILHLDGVIGRQLFRAFRALHILAVQHVRHLSDDAALPTLRRTRNTSSAPPTARARITARPILSRMSCCMKLFCEICGKRSPMFQNIKRGSFRMPPRAICGTEMQSLFGSVKRWQRQTRLFFVLSLTGSKFPMLTRNPERGKSPSSITSSVHLTSHGQSKMPATQVKKSKERHSR